MTPKEKAQELIDKMERPLNDDYVVDYNPYYKECALIAVNEIISNNFYDKTSIPHIGIKYFESNSYWEEVKKEIENL